MSSFSKDFPRRVALDERGDTAVSTVRLSTPYLGYEYETMWCIGDEWQDDCQRYNSLDAAIAGHKEMVQKVFGDKP